MPSPCPVCGQPHSSTHTCPGIATAAPSWTQQIPPRRFSLGHYFRQAVAIARLDEAAIVAASRDQNALFVGVLFWIFSQSLIFAAQLAPPLLRGAPIKWSAVPASFTIFLVFDAVIVLLQYGLCHGLALWWFQAQGAFIGILRAMALGSLVQWITIAPFAGPLVGTLWSIAILMRVLEAVDRIERRKALPLSVVAAILFWVIIALRSLR